MGDRGGKYLCVLFSLTEREKSFGTRICFTSVTIFKNVFWLE
jgi:hypothetical protein